MKRTLLSYNLNWFLSEPQYLAMAGTEELAVLPLAGGALVTHTFDWFAEQTVIARHQDLPSLLVAVPNIEAVLWWGGSVCAYGRLLLATSREAVLEVRRLGLGYDLTPDGATRPASSGAVPGWALVATPACPLVAAVRLQAVPGDGLWALVEARPGVALAALDGLRLVLALPQAGNLVAAPADGLDRADLVHLCFGSAPLDAGRARFDVPASAVLRRLAYHAEPENELDGPSCTLFDTRQEQWRLYETVIGATIGTPVSGRLWGPLGCPIPARCSPPVLRYGARALSHGLGDLAGRPGGEVVAAALRGEPVFLPCDET